MHRECSVFKLLKVHYRLVYGRRKVLCFLVIMDELIFDIFLLELYKAMESSITLLKLVLKCLIPNVTCKLQLTCAKQNNPIF